MKYFKYIIAILLLHASIALAAPERWRIMTEDGVKLASATSPSETGPMAYMGNSDYVVFTYSNGFTAASVHIMSWNSKGSGPVFLKTIKTYAVGATTDEPLGVEFDGQYIWAYYVKGGGSTETMDQIDPKTGSVVKSETVSNINGGPIAFPRDWNEDHEFTAEGSSVMYIVDRQANFAFTGDKVQMRTFPTFVSLGQFTPTVEPASINQLYAMTHTGKYLVLGYRASNNMHFYNFKTNTVVKTVSFSPDFKGLAYNGHNFVVCFQDKYANRK